MENLADVERRIAMLERWVVEHDLREAETASGAVALFKAIQEAKIEPPRQSESP